MLIADIGEDDFALAVAGVLNSTETRVSRECPARVKTQSKTAICRGLSRDTHPSRRLVSSPLGQKTLAFSSDAKVESDRVNHVVLGGRVPESRFSLCSPRFV